MNEQDADEQDTDEQPAADPQAEPAVTTIRLVDAAIHWPAAESERADGESPWRISGRLVRVEGEPILLEGKPVYTADLTIRFSRPPAEDDLPLYITAAEDDVTEAAAAGSIRESASPAVDDAAADYWPEGGISW